MRCFVDQETGLQNQRSLRKELAEAQNHIVVVVQVANFTDVLNVLGQERASQLLVRVSERLSAMTSGTIYRMNFNTLGWTIHSMTDAEHANQIEVGIALFNLPIEIDGRSIKVVPSFGSSDAINDGTHSLNLAMQAASRATERHVRWERHTVQHGKESDWRLALASELDAALASNEIWVAYQPKFDTRLGKITCAEALIRWSHPERGEINPEGLISIVERSGRISDLTCHVLRRTLQHQQEWSNSGLDLGIAVNVSAMLPADASFIRRVQEIVAEFPGSAERLTLEVTESAAIAQSDETVIALEKLAALGITISIDDYGTSQSTLSYLKKLPASEIKIDKSFVTDLEPGTSDDLLVTSTIQLAHSLGLRVVAEGVETEEIMAHLTEAGCDFIQGWHIARPMPANEIVEFVKVSKKAAA